MQSAGVSSGSSCQGDIASTPHSLVSILHADLLLCRKCCFALLVADTCVLRFAPGLRIANPLKGDRQRLSFLCPFLLLRNFEDDFEFDRHPQGKARNADDEPNCCLLSAEDVAKQVRHSIRYSGLVKEVTRGCYEHSEPHDPSHSIK